MMRTCLGVLLTVSAEVINNANQGSKPAADGGHMREEAAAPASLVETAAKSWAKTQASAHANAAASAATAPESLVQTNEEKAQATTESKGVYADNYNAVAKQVNDWEAGGQGEPGATFETNKAKKDLLNSLYAARASVATKNKQVATALASQIIPRANFLVEIADNNAAFKEKDKTYIQDMDQKMQAARAEQVAIDNANSKKAEDLLSQQTALSTQFKTALKTEVDALTSEILGTEADASSTLESSVDQFVSEYTGLKDRVEDDNQKHMDEISAAADVASEIVDTNREQKKQLAKDEKEMMKRGASLERLATSTKNALEKMVAREGKAAQKAVDQLAKSKLKDVKREFKAWKKDIKAVKNQNKREIKTLKENYKAIRNEFKTQVKEAKKAHGALSAAALTTLIDLDVGATDAKEQATVYEAEANKLGPDAMAKLSRLSDFASKDLVAATMTLGAAGVEAQKELDAAVNKMKSDFQTHARDTVLASMEQGDNAAATAADSIATAGREMSESVGAAKNQMADLQSEIGEDNIVLQEYQQQLNDTSHSLLLTKNNMLDQIAGYKNASDNAVDAVVETVNTKLKEARAALKTEKDLTAEESEDLAADASNALKARIEGLKEEAEANTGRADRSVKSAIKRGKEIVDVMANTTNKVKDIYDSITEQLPPVQKAVQGNLTKFKGVVSIANEKLAKVMTDGQKAIEDENTKIRGKLEKELSALSSDLTGQFDSTKIEMSNVVDGLEQTVGELKNSTNDDYFNGLQFQDRIRTAVDKDVRDITTEADATATGGSEMKERLRMAANTVEEALKGQGNFGSLMAKIVATALTTMSKAGGKSGEEAIQAAIAEGLSSLHNYTDDALGKLDDRMQDVSNLVKSNEDDMANLTAADNELHGELANAEGQAKTQIEGVKNTMQSLETTAAGYTAEIESEAEKQQKQLAEQKAYLEKQQNEMIDELSNANQQMVKKTAAEVEANVKEEEGNVKRQEEDDERSLAAMNARLETEEGEVEAGHKANEGALAQAQKDASLMENELTKDADQVKKVAEYGKEALKNEEMAEQGEMSTEVDKGLGLLEDALEAMDSAKEKSGDELKALDMEIISEIAKHGKIGKEKAKELANTVLLLISHSPDYAQLFNEDTADSRKDIEDAEERVAHAQNWMVNVMNEFKRKVNDTRDLRSQQAMALYSKASDLKRVVVGETERGVNQVAHIQQQLDQIKSQVDQQLADFRTSLDNLTQVDVDHDQKDVDEMDEKLTELMGHHINLMSWKDKEKHRTSQWRDAVEEQLRKLGKDVSREDADLKKSELEEEINMNNNLRKFTLRAAHEVSHAEAEETSQMAQAAATAAEEVSGAMQNQQANEAKKAQAEKNAMDALKRGEENNQGLLGSLDENTQNLQTKTADLDTATKTAKGAINALTLAQMTGSPQNIATDRRYDNLEVSIHAMQAKMPAGSFLETSSQVLPESLAEIKGLTHAEFRKRVANVKALNDDMLKANEKMEKQNSILASKIKYVKNLRKHKK